MVQQSKPIYKVWITVELERCDYDRDEYENLKESGPIDIRLSTNKKTASKLYKQIVDEMEAESKGSKNYVEEK